ncbi:MAG: OmpH family outer membrane protein [Bacteroidetes bacterium]|nr:OmpH family outer membrane protein [Bacteroidota bacterium]
MRLLALTAVITLIAFSSNAQKIAFVNQQIVQLMPEYAKAQTKIDSLSKVHQVKLSMFDSTYQALAREYSNAYSTLSEADKEDYIIQLESAKLRYQNYYQSTQKTLYLAEQEAMAPISEKIKSVIDQIAKDKGYDYVLDSSVAFFYKDENADITELVMDKLGIKLPEQGAATNGQ